MAGPQGRVAVLGRGPAVPLGNGTPAGFLKVLRDDSRLRAADEAKQAEARRKDEFLATLAHELRNPLAPVRNGAPDRCAWPGPRPTGTGRAG